MGYAIQHAISGNFEYALFLQDDQQLVRPILDKDIVNIQKFFENNQKAFQIYTCFLKKTYLKYDLMRMKTDTSGTVYLRKDIGRAGLSHFSAVGLFKIDRFMSLFEKFETGELQNDYKAKTNSIKMGFYRYPFMMWLPFPQSHRGKKRTLYRRTIEKLGKAGLYPINYMSDGDIKRLFQAKGNELPVAEQCLACPSVPENKYWSTTGGHSNLIALGGSRRLIGRILAKTQKLINTGPVT